MRNDYWNDDNDNNNDDWWRGEDYDNNNNDDDDNYDDGLNGNDIERISFFFHSLPCGYGLGKEPQFAKVRIEKKRRSRFSVAL